MPTQTAVAAAFAVCLAWFASAPASAGPTVIEADKFKFVSTDTTKFPMANDFELTIGGKFVGVPKSDVFPNRSIIDGATNGMAIFSGDNLNNNGETNITFTSNAVRNAPAGFFTFTDVNGKMTQISSVARSKALDGNTVVFNPTGGGYDSTLSLINDFGSTLTGSLTVYVNNGFSQGLFNLDDYATLRNATPVFTDSDFSLADGEVLSDIGAHLQSIDQYLLVLGDVDAGDGDGPSPFSLAITPATVPEPSILVSLAVAGLFLLHYIWRRRRAS
jgi:hypothetical protein